MLEGMEQELYEILNHYKNQHYIIGQLKSESMKKLILDNVNKAYSVVQCMNAILLYSYYAKDVENKKIFFNVMKTMQKDFYLYDEDMLELMETDGFKESMEIINNNIEKSDDIFIEYNRYLIYLSIYALKKDYSSAQEIVEIIVDNILDFVPFVSECKQTIEIIKDLSVCVSNLVEKQQNYFEEIKRIDIELKRIEDENILLAKLFQFLYAHSFVRENFDKNIKDFK